MHQTCNPAILYFGTPVVLISSTNEDGTINIAPMSSIFWLGWRCIIGMSRSSKTVENLIREKECVLNLPSVNEVNAVDKLALTTGTKNVPLGKQEKGYNYVPNKFEIAGLTPMDSEVVSPPGILECPVFLEAIVKEIHPIGKDNEKMRGRIVNIELEIVNVRVDTEILKEGQSNQIDPDKWKPLIMSFQHFYGLGDQVHPSRLADIPERLYKMS
ncbi:flavin reductase family protein [Galbibacter sp.]|uniref:flavin reductase family protein n=1 Tax=Galbibacter sp. TaxID=2918471 RepID=UPI003A949475